MNSKETSRRNFIKKSSLAGIGLSYSFITSGKEAQTNTEKKEVGKLNEHSYKILSLFNLKYPFFQAAPGGIKLAVAIAKAGGMGAIGLGWQSPEDAFETVKRMNKITNGNYYANYVLHFGTNSLDKALEAGCPTVQFSWGIPDTETVNKIKNAGARLGIQVSSKLNTQKALEHKPDFLICQGLEAGGHVQATSYLKDVLPQIIQMAGETPVLIAGGISTGHDIRKVINQGAAGTVMGSRFIATKEGNIHEHYKKRLVEAGENSTVYTNCFSGSGDWQWHAMHRVLRDNSTFLAWEAEGCPIDENRPGVGDIIANHPDSGNIARYSAMAPKEGCTGELDGMPMYAGQGVKNINDIPSAADLIKRLWEEFENQ